MSRREVTVADLARDPAEVARGLAAWRRGDRDEAVRATLLASGRDLHGRTPRVWIWAGAGADGTPAWLLPIPVAAAMAFHPAAPAAALARSLAAAVDAGARAERVRLADWDGVAAALLPGLDAELAPLALADRHALARSIAVAPLPGDLVVETMPLDLPPAPAAAARSPLAALARATGVHPVRVALTLAAHGQSVEDPPSELATSLREWGCSGEIPRPPAPEPALAIDDDPCPRRRHARRVLQRLLRMGKVGGNYHTEFDHLYRGAPPNERAQALQLGEALLRAGLLIEKPSVGQRHVSLSREALPAIHRLIDEGETDDPVLAALWTAPSPRTAATASGGDRR